MDILSSICIIVIILLITAYIYKSKLKQKQTEVERRVSRLADDLRDGGAGLVAGVGRVEGVVHVYIQTNEDACVGVCVCSSIQVMYWWRLAMENGHSLLVPGTADSITARAAAAAIRLWGNMWSQADRVVIFLENIRDSESKTRLSEQIEDFQNKFGVRVEIKYNNINTSDGGHALSSQLLGGGGVGQHEEGWYNRNLRIVGDVVHQLVDHTSKLSSHYFDI